MGGYCFLLFLVFGACTLYNSYGIGKFKQNVTATLSLDASAAGRPIPDTLFGIFFEVILLDLSIFMWGYKRLEFSKTYFWAIFDLVFMFMWKCGLWFAYLWMMNVEYAMYVGDQSCWIWWTLGRTSKQQRYT